LTLFKTTSADTAMIVPNAFFIVSVSPKNRAPNAIAKNGVNKLNSEHFLEPKTLSPI
jgi:hypothetical protein